jgi:hypothetical protein
MLKKLHVFFHIWMSKFENGQLSLSKCMTMENHAMMGRRKGYPNPKLTTTTTTCFGFGWPNLKLTMTTKNQVWIWI